MNLSTIKCNKIERLSFMIGILTISFVINIILFPCQVFTATNNMFYSDVFENWQQEAIYSAVNRGIIQGYEDGTFRPDQRITEAEFAAMISKSIKLGVGELEQNVDWAHPYDDESGTYALPLSGCQGGIYKDSPLPRGLAAKIIARIYGFELNVEEAVDFMYENGLANGRGEIKNFASYGAFEFLTRAEAVLFLNAMDQTQRVIFKGIQSDISEGKIARAVLYRSQALPVASIQSTQGRYALFQGKTYITSMVDIAMAQQYGAQFAGTYLIDQEDKKLVWCNFDKEIEFTERTNQGSLFLINRNYTVAEDYRTNKMINLAASVSNSLRVSDNEMNVDEVVFNPLKAMLNDSYYEGADKLVLISAFRSYQTQNMLFQSRVNELLPSIGLENAEMEVAKSTAVPGTSEHQTGLAIDFATLNTVKTVQSFANTREGQWLRNNSWKYGFVVRYKADKMYITGIINEPWHLRYVGVPHAEIMNNSDMCLEEYIDYISRERMLHFLDYQGHPYKIYYFDSANSDDLLSFIYLSDEILSISGDGRGGIILTTN